MTTIDYLAIGHVTDDLWPDGRVTAGGTVMYASRCARTLVDGVAVLTAAKDTLDVAGIFPEISVHRVDSPRTTQFWNVYNGSHRTQFTNPSPVRLHGRHLSEAMRASAIVHLAPVCDEADADILDVLPAEAFVGVTPQGWLRRWDADGRVTQLPSNWSAAAQVLGRANAAVMSIEDINGDWDTARAWAALSRLLVVTQSEEGCTLFFDGKTAHVPAPQVQQVDPTGAGDVFAATFFVALQRGAAPERAAEMANCLAAHSVTLPQMEGLPTPDVIARCFG
jgi:sugar/nucleoside kinase (ribokinase family)